MQTPINGPFCRVEPDHKRFLSFLALNDYPTPWDLEMTANTVVVRVFDNEGIVGYFWAHWVETGTLAFHACVSKDRRGPVWFNRRVLSELFQIAFWLGADELVASLDSVTNASRVRPMLQRLGFVHDPGRFGGESVFTLNLWEELSGSTIQPFLDAEDPERGNPTSGA